MDFLIRIERNTVQLHMLETREEIMNNFFITSPVLTIYLNDFGN